MSKIFVTSNTYFGRTSIIKARNFSDVSKMNSTIINNWNSLVNDDDTVYHLGNFGWDPMITEDIQVLLKGHINFIIGEYDQPLLDLKQYMDPYKFTILQRDFFSIPTKGICLTHWPLLTWPGKDNGVMQICGYDFPFDEYTKPSISVSQDKWGLKPIDIDVVIDILKEYNKIK